MSKISDAPRILVIRRDNIGDLVCTTPLISALRQQFPAAQICALVNSYNREVLSGNPNIDAVYWYTKGKHAGSLRGELQALWQRFQLIRRLRRMHFDYVILAFPGYMRRVAQLAGWLGAKQVIGYQDGGNDRRVNCPVEHNEHDVHEAEAVFRLLQPLGITGTPPAACVVADKAVANALRTRLNLPVGRRVYGVHISARKPSQRWDVDRFADMIKRLHDKEPTAIFLLLWAPGSQFNPQHPGDDERAAQLREQVKDMPIYPCVTQTLLDLIAALSLCDRVVCSDGGAMHLAAGLGKPIVALFGKSDVQHWHPWGVPHVVLQPPSLDVSDVSVEQVLAALDSL